MSAMVQVGDKLDRRVVPPITDRQMRAYLAVSGDTNPLHTEVSIAHRAGLEGIPVPGMLMAALLAEYVCAWPAGTRLDTLTVRFVKPVIVGQGVTIEGRVIALRAAQNRCIVRLAARHDGALTVMGEATVAL